MNRRGLLAMVHCARRDLGLAEDDYRAVLETLFGKSSASELSDRELVRVVEHFRAKGFAPPVREKAKRSTNPHVRKVWALWGDLERSGRLRHPGKDALRAFVERMTGVTDPAWLAPEQANQVVEGLKAWRARLERDAAARDLGPASSPVGLCRVCGCTDDDACGEHVTCHWVEPDLCSACEAP